MNKQIYQAYYHSKISTSKVFDKFYEFDENGEHVYNQINFNNFFEMTLGKKRLSIGICIKRYIPGDNYVSSGMTFSELKKHIGSKTFGTNERAYIELVDEAIKAINLYEGELNYSGVELPLEISVRFEAQSNLNRRGFGRYGEDDYVLYGNVDKYLITGIYVSTEPISADKVFKKKYLPFNKIVEMHQLTEQEVHEIKQRYRGIENRFVQMDADGSIMWDNSINP